ncbi:PREDICTED: E3 ubiquitin-protein ligase SGR9, amyloplastic [Theobroma cacao]|uniref:RING-type E3 ubiquitin transferase n=1 Tax=Theobroma cacao TaxID=3641 RepID=A0AB32V3B8_THECC|nr:PREDICTED: E3 ubiquitin-protein ligase SGR9, amyloplastic [Theobroma cacao]
MMMEEETTMMAALSTLGPSQLSDLSYSILSLSFHQRRRLCFLLSSPCLFSLTLHHLHSLSLPNKTLLIARHLLFSLHHITRHFQPPPLRPIQFSAAMKHRDLDAVLLLLFLCETHQHNPKALQRPHAEWRKVLSNICSDTMLRITGITSVFDGAALIPYIEMVTRCRRFVGILGCGGKEGREVAASPVAVVALPTVEVRRGGVECVICKEEMREGRDVCKLPCQHLFHWMCILPWLKKKNTCPCCRFQLPCDDIFDEIHRLWGVLVKASGKSLDGEWT